MGKHEQITTLPFADTAATIRKIDTLTYTDNFAQTLNGELVLRLIDIEHRAVQGARQGAQSNLIPRRSNDPPDHRQPHAAYAHCYLIAQPPLLQTPS
jgi:hypothetical protein